MIPDLNMLLVVAFICTAAGGVALGWLLHRSAIDRKALPDVSMDNGDILITNRLDEEVQLERIAANTPFGLTFQIVGRGNRIVEHWFRRSRDFNGSVAPRSQARLRLAIRHNARPSIVSLTFSSSGGTLRRKRVRVIVSA